MTARKKGRSYRLSSGQKQMDIVDAARLWIVRERHATLFSSSIAQSTDTSAHDVTHQRWKRRRVPSIVCAWPIDVPLATPCCPSRTAPWIYCHTDPHLPVTPLSSPPYCCVHNALRATTLQPLSSYSPVVAAPRFLRPSHSYFCPRRAKEKTGAAQEAQEEEEEWKWEKAASWRVKRILARQDAASVFPPEISASFHAGVITGRLFSFFSPFTFRVDLSLFPLASSPFPDGV